MAGLYAGLDRFQLNQELRITYNLKTPGPPLRHWECIYSAGAVVAYGKPWYAIDVFYSSISNQRPFRNSIGYAHNFYLNRIGTYQRTGTIHVQVARLSLITENDILAEPGVDKFRTGAVLLQYRHNEQLQIGLNCTAWTGRFGRRKIFSDSSWCYMDTLGGRFTSYSHGLLSAQAKFMLPYGQQLQASAGLDAEQVRDGLQNQVMHSLFDRRNCYMPLIDRGGKIFLYPDRQRLRRATLYSQAQANPAIFY